MKIKVLMRLIGAAALQAAVVGLKSLGVAMLVLGGVGLILLAVSVSDAFVIAGLTINTTVWDALLISFLGFLLMTLHFVILGSARLQGKDILR